VVGMTVHTLLFVKDVVINLKMKVILDGDYNLMIPISILEECSGQYIAGIVC
jgi:hypothetical protein